MKNTLLVLTCAALFAGCWTFNETDYPAVQTTMVGAGGTNSQVTVSLSGFEACLTEYEAVHGFSTVYVPGYYGYRCHSPGHYETVQTVSLVPQLRSTDMFLRRAQDEFEKAGVLLAVGAQADRLVDVRFEGPFVSTDNDVKRFAWNVFTVFFCDWAATRWRASLRIRDAKSGRLLFHHDYDQPYETGAFGLIPLFGASSCDKLSPASMQSWCLAALTDRACADATAFLAGEKR